MKLYVGNLSFETTENDLQDLFEQHGQVSEVALMMDRMTGKSRGFAFVTMNDKAQADAALAALNGKQVGGRALTVNGSPPARRAWWWCAPLWWRKPQVRPGTLVVISIASSRSGKTGPAPAVT